MAAERLEQSDLARVRQGWAILEPWQAYAVSQLLQRVPYDPCLVQFARAVPDGLVNYSGTQSPQGIFTPQPTQPTAPRKLFDSMFSGSFA